MTGRLSPQSFDVRRLGTWLTGPSSDVDRARSAAFAEAINDTNPDHRAGRRVPPMFNVVPCYPVLYRAVDLVTPPDFRTRAVHAGQDIWFERPLVIGSAISARARPIALTPARTGTMVTVELLVTDEDDMTMSQQYATAFVRGLVAPEAAGRQIARTAVPPAEPAHATARATVDADQTFRYAAASGDMMRLHLDDDHARAMGFRGIIAHGLCVMAMSSVAVTGVLCDGDPGLLRRLAVRLAAPVYPLDELITQFHRDRPPNPGRARFAFETTTRHGDMAIKNGVAEVGPRPGGSSRGVLI